ncbi:hypothetical protein P9314_04055 [Paenibacillus validus]|uniref:hypothetical protein n=1 Tax=Paenibacillus validus TaxID=44253 RepID=UPI001C3FAD25|nr:hypothetical protein [Paenibacillus validus]MED4599881.1 hypothetical protein [Paenibacillus validus]MED4606086.1 hypothetical protein [Paenibacillus validus]
MPKEISKDKKITKEYNRLKNLFKNIPTNTLKAVDSLLKNAAFMTVTLEDLQKKINDEGAVSKYQNGENQWGTKKSPEVEIFNTMIKNHVSIMKQLTDLIPEDPPPPPPLPPPKKQDSFEKILARGSGG